MTTRDELMGNLPLQYFDGPDYCTVKDATGGDFALTVQPELLKEMEAALTASASGEQQPAAYVSRLDLAKVRGSGCVNTILTRDPQRPAEGIVPVYTSAPPAAGWDEAIEAAALAAETDGSASPFAISAKVRIARRIRALRRESPACSGIFSSLTPEQQEQALNCRDDGMSRPDVGGGVREALQGILVEDDSDEADDECELCGGRGTVDAYTERTRDKPGEGRDEIGCPACIERSHSRQVRAALSTAPAAVERYSIEFDGFIGTVIGSYKTLEGKEGVVLQQDGTRVVHVYGRKHLKPTAVESNGSVEARLRVKPLEWKECWSGSDEDIPCWRGENPLGLLVDVNFAGQYALVRHSDAPAGELAARKAEAQARYEHRILSALSTPPAAVESNDSAEARRGATYRVDYDGFVGTKIGVYRTREGREGVVLQQADTKIVHVYGANRVEEVGDEAKKSEGGKEPRGCPTPGACSCPSDPTADTGVESRVRRILCDGWGMSVDSFMHRFTEAGIGFVGTQSAYGEYTPIIVRASTKPSDPTADRREIVARLAYGLSNNPDLWDHPHSVLTRGRAYEVADEILAALAQSEEKK